ncbi:MAG: putative LPS assembly protein LptD [Gammaproteobacteria bacterium]|nr:putative LPS assembly protein LptD [Gammaproteobacteria bacterium]MDE0257570.1 putative LPS assembly protein LptD [Gammaproteobacteria bacterium]
MAPDPRRRRARLPTALLLPLVVAGLPIPAHGQQTQDSIPPPGPPDTTVVVDSARVQVLEVLQRLAAPPLPDSLRELPDSTVRAPRPVAPGPDSVLNALLSLPGYQASQYEGAGLEFGSSGEVILYGNPDARARFFREGAERMQLEADSSITMDDSTNLIWTEGASVFTGREGEPLNSTSMIYSLDSQRGTAYSARTRFAEGGSPWNVFGDLPSVTPEIVHGAHVGFTSCDLEHPHYHFDTSEIKIVAGNMLVARSVKLYFADVPVFWFPFMFQSIERGRASGILTPRFSVNDIVRSSAGYSRRVSNLGFYWAINDYADASVAMDWWADNYVGVTGTLNYNWLRQFLRGNVNFRNFWREDGSTTLAFSTSHNWELDERTRFEIRSSYASSTDFVRQNSFDPREVTQSIDSQGGINRRFDWGNVSMSANRRQFLSDDRVSLTLPSTNLSLSPITFFSAPSSRASWYNNIIWTGSGNYTRSIEDRLDQPPGEFKESLADKENTRGGLSSSLSLGALSLSHSLSFNEAVTRDGLEVFAPAAGLAAADRLEAWFGSVVAPAADSASPERVDLSSTDLTWSQTLSYQQRLIGTTTFTPNLSMSGRALQTNKIPEAGSLVSAPTRISFGAGLKTDLYGLWPGVGGFSAIRHKLSPGFDYSYAPAVTQTEVQNAVFGRGEFRAKNEMRIRLNQTFEAKRETGESEEEEEEAPPDPSGEPRRRERAEIVQLLALQTSAVNYDFVRADSLGQFTDGFTTTTLSNSISSDFLRGLQISMEHLLFDESGQAGEGRQFAPHLSGLDLSFSLNAASPPLRWIGGLIGLGGDGEADPEPEPEEDELLEEEDPFSAASGLDESQIVPGFGDTSRDFGRQSAQGRPRGGGGGWDASVSYSLQRPRQADLARQMVQLNVRFEPTELWRASWRTSYDVELGSFNDHMITFTRQLHRWEANFDFRRTVTGNWAFRFEVALSDNRDLKFDYQQYDRSDPLERQFR